MKKLDSAQARRIALGAQGFTAKRPAGRVDARHFRKLFRTIGLLQLDSVNVLERSHYLPVFARLGHYDRAALDRYTSHSREIFEYWAHEASLIPAAQYPLMRFRMNSNRWEKRLATWAKEERDYIAAVLGEIRERGPLSVSDLEDPGGRTGPWWGYQKGKIALEWLFGRGDLTAYRGSNFKRVYEIPERYVPEPHYNEPPPAKEDAMRALLVDSARHHGVGTARDLADYYRLHVPTSRKLLHDIAAEGLLEPVAVEGWKEPAWLHPESKRPRAVQGSALLSPFDSLVWERARTERLFDFRYRIEIYVPKPKRVHGYYVLPFLMDGELVARVDLKADRKASKLLVQSAFLEEGRPAEKTAARLADDLVDLAHWLGLQDVVVGRKGNLVTALRAEVKSRS
ncbi:MAG: winged helix-turn-helix domain-containing protein [Gemmatimonadetes bacterium]|nr:winged helix-turn-helix domain-containing protein [Gemmatimonadota bacterium]